MAGSELCHHLGEPENETLPDEQIVVCLLAQWTLSHCICYQGNLLYAGGHRGASHVLGHLLLVRSK